MEKSAKSTLKVRKKTRVFIGKLVVGVALCDNSNNKSFSLCNQIYHANNTKGKA